MSCRNLVNSGRICKRNRGNATAHAVDAIARQPEADSKIMRNLLLGSALAEATAIYGFVLGILIIFML